MDLEVLKECNCGKCRYLGRIYNQCQCFWAGLNKGRVLFPDFWHPMVCKNFEPLREGEELGMIRGREDKMKDIRVSELIPYLNKIEDELRLAISPIISKIEIPYNVGISIDVDLLDNSEMGSGQRSYLAGKVKLRPTFL